MCYNVLSLCKDKCLHFVKRVVEVVEWNIVWHDTWKVVHLSTVHFLWALHSCERICLSMYTDSFTDCMWKREKISWVSRLWTLNDGIFLFMMGHQSWSLLCFQQRCIKNFSRVFLRVTQYFKTLDMVD